MRHYVRKRQRHIRRSLRNAAKDGEITLVLGAGVSIGRGVPSWSKLVRELWQELKPKREVPEWLAGKQAPPHPLAYQILLEEIEGATRSEIALVKEVHADTIDPSVVRKAMVRKIRNKLYGSPQEPTDADTLSVLIALLQDEQRRADCRIVRVITFNADDLLERGTNEGKDMDTIVAYPIPRASYHPKYGPRAHGRRAIDVYHLHGFVPHKPYYNRGAEDTLVFTDAEYWESVANPASFANRVMQSALHLSNCVFIGMSMTDVNMMRWLGLRFDEFVRDRSAGYAYNGYTPARAHAKTRQAISRHYWICTVQDDPERFIASHLERRGVQTYVLPEWGEPFKALIEECFRRP
ncbi:MAG: SIR2 family protein [Pseudomonadota bacterium]